MGVSPWPIAAGREAVRATVVESRGRATGEIRFLDRGFVRHVRRYLFQSALATGSVGGILLAFDLASQTALTAALGASAFIAFALPHTRASTPRCMIGGYAVGMTVGIACHWAAGALMVREAASPPWAFPLVTAAAVGLAMFAMVLTDTEHAPAAGITLGMKLNPWSYLTIGSVLFGVCCLALIKGLLGRFLINLCTSAPLRPPGPQTRPHGAECPGHSADNMRDEGSYRNTVARSALSDRRSGERISLRLHEREG